MNTLPRLFRVLFLCLFALTLSTMAWAGGDPSDGHSHAPAEQSAPVVTGGGATQTEIELRLTDLNAGATGTEPPLAGAKLRGLLKRAATGETLGRIEAHATDTPGVYKIHFGDREAYQFSQAGKYALELNIQPTKGEAIDTTVEFTLPAATTSAAPPLWRRALPFALGALAVAVLLGIALKRRRRPPGATPMAKEVVGSTLALALCVAAIGSPVWAGGDPSDGHSHAPDESQEAAPAASTAPVNPNIQLGETTTTAKAGPIRITVTTRTAPAVAQAAAPGEVALPPQTAELLQIKTQPVTVAQLPSGIAFTGQIAANPNGVVRVASIVPGRVTRLAVAQGDTVRQGQVVAIVESRAIGEAQSAYQQAAARLQNARSNLDVVQRQARAGVFSRAPVETARRAQVEAAGDVRTQEIAVQQARVTLDNTLRLARAGAYANPAVEAARVRVAEVHASLNTAEAELANAQARLQSATTELRRRQEQAEAGTYRSRPVQEAQRSLSEAQAARGAASSEVATTRTNLARAKSLAVEGLISQRDLEAAQQAFDTATARLQTAQANEAATQQELEREQKLAATNVAGAAEIQEARTALAVAGNEVRKSRAEVKDEREQKELAETTLRRERVVFTQNIANRREVSSARTALENTRAALSKARQTLAVNSGALEREQRIFRQNLNNTAQVQTARAGYVQAQADARAARSTLTLFKSAPGGSVLVPIRAPLSGVVQTRDVAVGELIQADAPLLTVVNLNSVALEAQLFEADVARVRIGSLVTITTQAAPGRTFSGRIGFIGSELDPQTRTLTARALIDNPGVLRPGMFARGQIQTGLGQLSISVPESAVLDDGAAKVAFVAKGGKYERREVTTGNASNGRIEIKSGLKQGETVVTAGAAALRAQAAKGS